MTFSLKALYNKKVYQLPVNYDKLPHNERRVVREQYVKVQDNLCYHCKHPLDKQPPEFIMSKVIRKRLFPNNFFKYPVHLHHNHRTGMTIGAVHARCNAVLWQYHGE